MGILLSNAKSSNSLGALVTLGVWRTKTDIHPARAKEDEAQAAALEQSIFWKRDRLICKDAAEQTGSS